ncbi:hypothetical protein VTI74DRAFT_566 [Chaetomium olivicolor]
MDHVDPPEFQLSLQMVVQQDRTLLQSEKVPPGSVSVRNLKNNPDRPIQGYGGIYYELLGQN